MHRQDVSRAERFECVECRRINVGVDSVWKLRLDLATANILVWTAQVGRSVELTPDTHLYFHDRYRRLAEYHRRRGNPERARRMQNKAETHYRLGGGDGPPYAAAMGMPRPWHWVRTTAVSKGGFHDSDDAA